MRPAPAPVLRRIVGALLAAWAVGPAAAQPATRAELAAQRDAIELRFAREEAACHERFAVNTCLEAARERRRQDLAPLVRREHELAAEERRERADAQARRIRERELAASQGPGMRPERAAAAAAWPAPPASRPARREPADTAGRDAQAEAAAAMRRERAEQRQADLRARQAEHRAREQARVKPPAAPLPLPGASAASAAR